MCRNSASLTRPVFSPLRAFLPFAAVLALLIGCSVEHDWYPSGKVTIVDHYQTDDYGSPVVSIVYRIDNPSATGTTIYATTAVFTVETDLTIYRQTVVDTSVVLAGHFVFGTCDVALRESEEVHDSVSLLDSFFE